jgi:hypothetical protein
VVQDTRLGSGERRSPALGTAWLLYEGADPNTVARRALLKREPRLKPERPFAATQHVDGAVWQVPSLPDGEDRSREDQPGDGDERHRPGVGRAVRRLRSEAEETRSCGERESKPCKAQTGNRLSPAFRRVERQEDDRARCEHRAENEVKRLRRENADSVQSFGEGTEHEGRGKGREIAAKPTWESPGARHAEEDGSPRAREQEGRDRIDASAEHAVEGGENAGGGKERPTVLGRAPTPASHAGMLGEVPRGSRSHPRQVRRRLSRRALTATSTLEPDMEMAASSGRSVKPQGSKTPAAIGSASEL